LAWEKDSKMAVYLDATGGYLRRDSLLVGVGASKKFTLSAWFNIPTAAAAGQSTSFLVLQTSGGASNFIMNVPVSGPFINTVQISTRGVSGAVNISAFSQVITRNVWHHVVASVDLSAASIKMYIDRVAATLTTLTQVDENIDFRGASNGADIWSLQQISLVANIKLYDVAFWPGLFVDLDTATELRKFISSDGQTDYGNPGPTAGTPKPVGYPLGILGTPAVLFSGAFRHNLGSGGSFTYAGAYTSAAGPDVYRQSGSPDAKPGERSFDSDLSGWTFPRSQTFIERREGNPHHGSRMGLSEKDDQSRQDVPSVAYQQLIFSDDEEDEEESDNV